MLNKKRLLISFYNNLEDISYYNTFNSLELKDNDFILNYTVDETDLSNSIFNTVFVPNLFFNINFAYNYKIFLFTSNYDFNKNSTKIKQTCLTFLINNITFKIFSIKPPNYSQMYTYYIVFKDINEINNFVQLIQKGTINTNKINSNFFNESSLNFSLNSNNVYQIVEGEPKTSYLNFNINVVNASLDILFTHNRINYFLIN